MFSLLFHFACHGNELSEPILDEELLHRMLINRSIYEITQIPGGVQAPIDTSFGEWQLSLQLFPEHNILYVAINNYLWLDSSVTAQSTVFSLTQMLTQNHQMMGGKFQLNPQNGAITIGTELVVIKTIQEAEIQQAIDQLLFLGNDNYPMLKQALGGHFY